MGDCPDVSMLPPVENEEAKTRVEYLDRAGGYFGYLDALQALRAERFAARGRSAQGSSPALGPRAIRRVTAFSLCLTMNGTLLVLIL